VGGVEYGSMSVADSTTYEHPRSSVDRIRTRILLTLLQVVNNGMDVVDFGLLTNSDQSSGRSYPGNDDGRPRLGTSLVFTYEKSGT
jgi:hypothetical protein